MNKQHFLTAIAADPCNSALRLQFADWLEERGDPLAVLWRQPQTPIAIAGNYGVVNGRVFPWRYGVQPRGDGSSFTPTSHEDGDGASYSRRLHSDGDGGYRFGSGNGSGHGWGVGVASGKGCGDGVCFGDNRGDGAMPTSPFIQFAQPQPLHYAGTCQDSGSD